MPGRATDARRFEALRRSMPDRTIRLVSRIPSVRRRYSDPDFLIARLASLRRVPFRDFRRQQHLRPQRRINSPICMLLPVRINASDIPSLVVVPVFPVSRFCRISVSPADEI
jgi:hypothetical protein